MHRLPGRKQQENIFLKAFKRKSDIGLLPAGEPTAVKLDEICDLAIVQVNANCIVDLNEGVWVADGAGVVGHQVGDSFGANDNLLDFAQLVL